jgi:hypothetical protein
MLPRRCDGGDEEMIDNLGSSCGHKGLEEGRFDSDSDSDLDRSEE